MNKNFGGALKAAAVYVAVVIGAGFATGQEILSFFVKNGQADYLAVVTAGAVLALVGWAVMDVCLLEGLSDGSAFIMTVMGRRLGSVMEVVVGSFLCVMFCAMLAGTGATLKEAFDLPFSLTVSALACLCFVQLSLGASGIEWVNKVLAPVLVTGGVAVGLWAVLKMPSATGEAAITPRLGGNAATGLIYASYNAITAVMVLAGLPNIVKSRQTAKWGGLIGGGALGLLGLLFAAALSKHYSLVRGFDVPMLTLSAAMGSWAKTAYLAVLLAAVYTTAISNAFAASKWLAGALKLDKALAAGLVCFGGIVLAHIGFAALVGKVYAFFGVLGLLEVILIIVKHFTKGGYSYGKQGGKLLD